MSNYSVKLISGITQSGGDFPLVHAKDVEVGNDGSRLDDVLAGIGSGAVASVDTATTEEALDYIGTISGIGGGSASGSVSAASTAFSPIVCWGDSLTYGYAEPLDGNALDGSASGKSRYDWKQRISYPDVLADLTGRPVINLGVSSETIQTIMARQGADPMTTPAFTIPEDTSPVEIGSWSGGLTTVNGEKAQPLSTANSGINPCTIAGVKGYLTCTGQGSGNGNVQYYFQRAKSGSAVNVASGTVIYTYAMRKLRGCTAVIWMGRNGSKLYTPQSMKDFVDAMVEYGQYSNYLVLACDEVGFTASTDANMTAEEQWYDLFGDHFLYLKPLLGRIGCNEAGLRVDGSVNSRGVAAELDYDGIHFNSYGNRAIGSFVFKHMLETGMLNSASGTSGDAGGEDDNGGSSGGTSGGGTGGTTDLGGTIDTELFDVNGTDDNGAYVLKLKDGETYTLGGNNWINTGYAPYDTDGGNSFTIFYKLNGLPSGKLALANANWAYNYGDQRGFNWFFTSASAFDSVLGNNPIGSQSAGVSLNTTGTNTIVMRKSGDTYGYMVNGIWAAGNSSIGGNTEGCTFLNDLPLWIGAEHQYSNSVKKSSATVTLTELVMYKSALNDSDITSILGGGTASGGGDSGGAGSGGSDSGGTSGGDSGNSGTDTPSTDTAGAIDATLFDTDGSDTNGAFSLKLKSGKTWTGGGGNWINTGLTPVDADGDAVSFTAVYEWAGATPSGRFSFISANYHHNYGDQRGTSVYWSSTNGYDSILGNNPFGFSNGGITMASGTNKMVVRKSGTTYGVCVNGTWLHGNTNIGSDVSSAEFVNGLPIWIGAEHKYQNDIEQCAGTLTFSELTLYTVALTNDQINAMF